MGLFFYITIIVALAVIYLSFLLVYYFKGKKLDNELKKKELEVEEKKLELEMKKLDSNPKYKEPVGE